METGKTYKFINVKAHNCLDLSGADNRSIIGYGFHDGENQKWIAEWTGNHWVFRNAGTGLYLGFDGQPRDGTPLIATSNRVEWDVWPDEKDTTVYRIFVPGWEVPINVDLSDHGNANPGTPITLWGKWEGEHQTWKIEQGESTYN